MTKKQKAEAAEWQDKLRRLLPPGSTVHTVLRHVSRSGMTRRVDLYILHEGDATFITGMAAAAMGMRWDHDKGGIIVGGCGMDMGFHLVYNLARTLYPDGHDCIGDALGVKRCPSNDHSNGDRNYSPDHHHADGGYALLQRWM